jgi:hypothetical protein
VLDSLRGRDRGGVHDFTFEALIDHLLASFTKPIIPLHFLPVGFSPRASKISCRRRPFGRAVFDVKSDAETVHTRIVLCEQLEDGKDSESPSSNVRLSEVCAGRVTYALSRRCVGFLPDCRFG